MIKSIPAATPTPYSIVGTEPAPERSTLLYTEEQAWDGRTNSESVGDAPVLNVRQVFASHPSDEAFFQALNAELQKSAVFYDKALVEFRIREERLCNGAAIVGTMGTLRSDDRWIVFARGAYQLYKDLLLLESYAILNYCAFSKILKKYDKWTGNHVRPEFMNSLVEAAGFTDTSELQAMIRRCEHLYNEASRNLVDDARNSLHEDERLFIGMVARINSEVIVPALKSENSKSLPFAPSEFLEGASSNVPKGAPSDSVAERHLTVERMKGGGPLDFVGTWCR